MAFECRLEFKPGRATDRFSLLAQSMAVWEQHPRLVRELIDPHAAPLSEPVSSRHCERQLLVEQQLPGSLAGGQLGARIARHFPPALLFKVIASLGAAAAAWLMTRQLA